MNATKPAYQRLFLHNAVLLASSFGALLLVILLLLFSLSYTALAPQMLNTLVRGYSDLPPGTDYAAVWDSRADNVQELPLTIEALALYHDGELVNQFNRQPRRALPHNIEFLPAQASLPRLQRLHTLDDAGRWQLYAVANASLLNEVYGQTLIAIGFICLLGALLVFLVSLRFQRSVARPIHHLMSVAWAVDREENFTVRARKSINDDMGDLVDAFNGMLQRVETRDVQLQSERDRAEKAQVQAQTLARETRDANQRLEFEVQVRAKVERKLTEFQAYLNAMINSMPSALIAVDEHALITQWNDEASRLSGRALDMALGYSLDEAIPLMKGYMDRLSRALLEKDIQRIERVPYTLEDRDYLLDMVIYPLHLVGTIGAVIRIDDVSDKVRMEEMMVQSEKMMSVGGLAAGMAHEINNPLSAIVQSVQTIRRRLHPDIPANQKAAEETGMELVRLQNYLNNRDVPRFLDHILSAGERAAAIVTNMLQFSRQSDTELQPSLIVDLIERALAIAQSDLDLRSSVQSGQLIIEHDWADCVDLSLPVANTEIEQVLFNIIKNAWQAILARQEPDFVGHIHIRCFRQKQHCVIQVSDNGKGMDLKTKKRVFEPFFTTKEVGEGTGLGLSVAYFIITSHHRGQLSVKSEPDSGTTFTLKLPLSQGT